MATKSKFMDVSSYPICPSDLFDYKSKILRGKKHKNRILLARSLQRFDLSHLDYISETTYTMDYNCDCVILSIGMTEATVGLCQVVFALIQADSGLSQ
jgi:hypothetical protein